MLEKLGRIRLLYIVLGVLLLVGLAPMAFTGILLSGRSADELRAVEGRYQAQLVQDKARQIELYGQRYRDVVTGLARAFEISGGIRALDEAGYDLRLEIIGLDIRAYVNGDLKISAKDPNMTGGGKNAILMYKTAADVYHYIAYQP